MAAAAHDPLATVKAVDHGERGALTMVVEGAKGEVTLRLAPIGGASRRWWFVHGGRLRLLVTEASMGMASWERVEGQHSTIRTWQLHRLKVGDRVPLRRWFRDQKTAIADGLASVVMVPADPPRMVVVEVPQPTASDIVGGRTTTAVVAERPPQAGSWCIIRSGTRPLPGVPPDLPLGEALGVAYVAKSECIEPGRWRLRFGFVVRGCEHAIRATLWAH